MKKAKVKLLLPECRPKRQRVRIPFLRTQETHDPIANCVINASEKMSITPVQMAACMAYFFEEVIEAVKRKEIVCVPGFGRFGAMTSFRRVTSKHGVQGPRSFPAFVAYPPFKREVVLSAPPSSSPETDKMRNLMRKRSSYYPKKHRMMRNDYLPKFIRHLGLNNTPERLATLKIAS